MEKKVKNTVIHILQIMQEYSNQQNASLIEENNQLKSKLDYLTKRMEAAERFIYINQFKDLDESLKAYNDWQELVKQSEMIC